MPRHQLSVQETSPLSKPFCRVLDNRRILPSARMPRRCKPDRSGDSQSVGLSAPRRNKNVHIPVTRFIFLFLHLSYLGYTTRTHLFSHYSTKFLFLLLSLSFAVFGAWAGAVRKNALLCAISCLITGCVVRCGAVRYVVCLRCLLARDKS